MCCSIKNKAQEGTGECWEWVYISNGAVREDLTEKVTFEQRLKGGTTARHTAVFIPDVGKATKGKSFWNRKAVRMAEWSKQGSRS